MTLPTDSKERKATPITTGVLDYFPDALAEVARVSKVGNDQHNPGEPLHWSREKSTDHADCITRHLLERGTLDADGMRHSAKMAWRALALLQIELETGGEKVTVAVKRPQHGPWCVGGCSCPRKNCDGPDSPPEPKGKNAGVTWGCEKGYGHPGKHGTPGTNLASMEW